tara:strand:+ start:5776 stop:6882 length:1107 start_codon:yes stop_codon:yes gene_type:complete
MHELVLQFEQVLALNGKDETFENPEQRQVLLEDTQKLKKTLMAFHEERAQNMADPLFSYNVQAFSADLDLALVTLADHKDYLARPILNQTPNYCISCHSRTANGRTDLHLANPLVTGPLNPAVEVSYLFALRQYDQGVDRARAVIHRSTEEKERFHALVNAANILIRIERDPKEAKRLFQFYLESSRKKTPWTKDVKAWVQSYPLWSSKIYFGENPASMDQIRDLLKASLKHSDLKMAFPELMVASENLHHILAQSQERDESYFQALFYLGVTYNSLNPIYPNHAYEAFYKRCIRDIPNSKVAKSCYTNLASRLKSGSYSTLPEERKKKIDRELQELETLANDQENILLKQMEDSMLDFGDRVRQESH